MMKKIILGLLLAVCFLLQPICSLANEQEQQEVVEAKVIAIIKDEIETYETSGSGYSQRVQIFKVKLTKGKDKGKLIEVTNALDEMMAYSFNIRVGDSIYCLIERDEQGELHQGYLYEVKRDTYLVYLVVLFALLMLLIGKGKGLKTLITLSITILGVYYMLTGILNGGNPILLSIIVSIGVTILTMLIISGFNRKTLAAIIGTMAGVLLAGLIYLFISYKANFSGIASSEAQTLLYSQTEYFFDFKGILFGSIILGTLGAVMDVSMSIASAIQEVKEANPMLTKKELFFSGMNIGKDIMGTMSNTLILAYTGTSICLLLIFMVNKTPMRDIVNLEIVATEIVRAMAGTIGLIISIPISSITAAFLNKPSHHLTDKEKDSEAGVHYDS